jgi:hypothetical protein
MNSTLQHTADDTGRIAAIAEVRNGNVNARSGPTTWEIWHFSGYVLASA